MQGLSRLKPYLQDIRGRQEAMIATLARLSEINSGSRNIDGLARMADAVTDLFDGLGADIERESLPDWEVLDDNGELRTLPLGPVLRLRRHADAPRSVLLVGHMDTVFGPEHPFQQVRRADGRLHGPGVADLKGGLLVMWQALTALEASPFAGALGWEVLLNPDEEIGSPGSAPLLAEAAGRHDLGLVFEPAMPDGVLAGARRGSGNFAVVVRGRAAHAGREHALGRNAVRAAADFVAAIDDLNGQRPGVTVNAGFIHGGGPVNVVPDRCLVRLNVRVTTTEDGHWVARRLREITAAVDARDGIGATLHGGFTRPPKPMDPAHERLFDHLRGCGTALGMDVSWRDTGGCCDGNNLAAAGLPNVDTLGVVGGGIHSADEYVDLDSLAERTELVALLLLALASDTLQWQWRAGP